MFTKQPLFIGLMSGTSMDAIDAVLVRFSSDQYEVIAASSHSIDDTLRSSMLAINGQTPLKHVARVDTQVAEEFALATNELINQACLKPADIAAVGSHGQTVAHYPNPPISNSIQIGNPNLIAQLTGIPVISDFRRRDIAAGGQGAPLVPIFHSAFMRDSSENRCVVNIGGIANVSLLPADSSSPVTGFDTGPGNCLMDSWIRHHQQVAYDKDGNWGKSGSVHDKLLEVMWRDSFFKSSPPKSTGREHFNLSWLQDLLDYFSKSPIAAEDVQATLTELTAVAIIDAVKTYASETNRLLVCGGGVNNLYLMQRLTQLAGDVRVESTASLDYQPQWIEAAAFAYLAKLTLDNQPGNLPSVTGASQQVILGGIYPS